MLSSEIVQALSLRVADNGMKIAFLQSAADQKRLQAVLELKTDRYNYQSSSSSSRMMMMMMFLSSLLEID